MSLVQSFGDKFGNPMKSPTDLMTWIVFGDDSQVFGKYRIDNEDF